MYEDEKNEKTINESGSASSSNAGQWNANNTSDNTNPYSYRGGNSNNTSSQRSPYSYGGGTSYNSQYGSSATQNNSYSGQGGYGSSYSYGQNSYSYNNQNGQPNYGTYQYSSNMGNNVPPVNKPPKKHTGAKVVAAICAVALLVCGAGYAYNNYGSKLGLIGSSDQAAIESSESATTETPSTETTQDTQASAATEEATGDSGIKATTTNGATMAVVTDVTAVVEEVMPAMVMIHNNYTASASYFGYIQTEEATASGSGIIVGENDTELLIATNYHVIEGADSLEVIFTDDSTVEAVVKGTDSDMDLAVIAVMLEDIDDSTRSEIKIATLGDSDTLQLGEPAIAIGNALGYGQSVTTGVISAVNRDVEIEEGTTQTFIQTDAAINPGNSGGALLNLQGEVIGINSNKIGGDTIEGMGYAIPISVAKPIIEELMNEQTMLKVDSSERGYIGISGVSVTSDVSAGYGIPQGVYVAEISDGGGAEAAGLEKGDVIVEFDGKEITSMDDLQKRLQYYAAGTTVSISVMRQNGADYEELSYDVTLGYASNTTGADSNAAEEGGANGQYDGSEAPALPGGKNGQHEQGQQSEGGH